MGTDRVRILVRVADAHLAEAMAAALAPEGSVRVAPTGVSLGACPDWDVCISDDAFAAEAIDARDGRGLIILCMTAHLPPPAPLTGQAPLVVRLRTPFSLGDLRRAMRTVARGPLPE